MHQQDIVSYHFRHWIIFVFNYSFVVSYGDVSVVLKYKTGIVYFPFRWNTFSKCYPTPSYIRVLPQDVPLFCQGLLNRSIHLKIHVCQIGALLLAVILQAFICLVISEMLFLYIFLMCKLIMPSFFFCYFHLYFIIICMLTSLLFVIWRHMHR